ncbi:MAG: hypothetical protein ABR867_05250 [Nitrososphaerales archaeon]
MANTLLLTPVSLLFSVYLARIRLWVCLLFVVLFCSFFCWADLKHDGSLIRDNARLSFVLCSRAFDRIFLQ